MPQVKRASFQPSLKFKTRRLRALRPQCDVVLKEFRLPAGKLLCCFDDEDPSWLHSQKCYGAFKGFHIPVSGVRPGLLPRWVREHLFGSDYLSKFDNLIYIPETEYSTLPESFALIFAHELQHFVQYCEQRKAYDACVLLHKHLISVSAIKSWDFPHERDAMMVSKHVAKKALGTSAVEAKLGDPDKEELLKFYLSQSPSGFDFLAATQRWVEQHKPLLLSLDHSEVEPLGLDFTVEKWWL